MDLNPLLFDYVEQHNPPEPKLLQQLVADSQSVSKHPDKICGRSVGRLLCLLSQLTQAKLALDLGSFTGYSAFCIAEGMATDGRVLSCDTNPRALEIANSYRNQFAWGYKTEFHHSSAQQLLAQIQEPVDLIFIDADKKAYPQYYEQCLALLAPGGLMILDNMLWHNQVMQPEAGSIAAILAELNHKIAHDQRVRACFLSQRDGLQLVIKHSSQGTI